ncbi:hypothetical protein HF325_005689 [Metschnikowia pulcherrima]|uniref:EamA domain-containing protein n=1 Tax=Metschnikowia pulcherrima TaxID=27326 RepID=A0A8H7GLT5_9ASCO|nr:hypothetical protein HF325_005689 [Metschnikowia pulcherrima]
MLRKLQTSLATFIQSFLSVLRPESQLLATQKWALGLLNLSMVIVFWVGSSFLVNDLFESNVYRKPFFITWINTSCFVFYLIPYLKHHNYSVAQFLDAGSQGRRGSRAAASGIWIRDTSESDLNLAKIPDDEVGICETLLLSLQFIVLWFSANLVTNASLSYTLVASQTILSSTLSFFTLIFGYLYRIEKINRNKILGIVLSFSGVLIVTKIDSTSAVDVPEGSTPLIALWGNVLALAGALIYGIYTILLKHKITRPDTAQERTLNTHLFFGDFCWCKAVLLTSPLTVTVGLSLTIPLAMVGDWVFKGFHVNFWYLFGAVIVTLGFLVINKDEQDDFTGEAE